MIISGRCKLFCFTLRQLCFGTVIHPVSGLPQSARLFRVQLSPANCTTNSVPFPECPDRLFQFPWCRPIQLFPYFRYRTFHFKTRCTRNSYASTSILQETKFRKQYSPFPILVPLHNIQSYLLLEFYRRGYLLREVDFFSLEFLQDPPKLSDSPPST